MSAKQSSYLVNLNRLLILVLTLIGMLMDGYQSADLPIILSLVFWLWLPVCTRLEESAFNYIEDKGRHSAQGNDVTVTATERQVGV